MPVKKIHFPDYGKIWKYCSPQVMWGVDDEIRDLFKALRDALKADEKNN